MFAGSMFVKQFLFLAVLDVLLTNLMACGQRVVGLEATPFVQPLLLPARGVLFRLLDQRLRLEHGLIQTLKKNLVVVQGIAVDTIAGGGHKTLAIFDAILLQQRQSAVGFLFAGKQFAQLARGFIHAQLGKVKQRLQGKEFAHGEIPKKEGGCMKRILAYCCMVVKSCDRAARLFA